MSVPTTIYNILDSATTTTVAPFVRPHDKDFPCVVYRFDGDSFEGSRYGDLGVRRTEVTAHCLARTLAAAETIADDIITYMDANEDCVRITRVDREYDPSYDGQRSGIYDVSVSFIYFEG
jgi:hypothetical protein|tara:strand:+ start:295 stop:654 length:360 start_codon:yes stop_codon:yes gene_type:complete